MWILMENQNYSSIYGNANAPYETQIANQCGLATNYHAIGHPSLPNYIALTSGSTQGITDDSDPSSHPLDVPSIFHQAYPSAKGYAETMPSNCFLTNSGSYYVRHAPWAYYINGTVGNQRTECQTNDVPMGTYQSGNFHNDVVNGTLPNFSFVTPNGCDDMHDCSVATGDAYLANLVPTIIAGPDYQAGHLAIVIVFDENGGASGNQVYAAVISPFTVPGTQSATNFTHYSLLRTTEEILGVPLLGGAATAASMRTPFGL
jgi:phospholipase C